MKIKGFALIPVLIILSLVVVGGFILWPRKTNDKFATGLNNRVIVRLDSKSTASENNGIFTLSMPDKKRIEISEIENRFPQAKTAKEYNTLDRKNYEGSLTAGGLSKAPGFTDEFIQEVEKKGPQWDSAIEVKGFHLASAEGLEVRKFIALKNSNVYEIYFIFPPDSKFLSLVIPTLQYNITFK